MRHEDAAGIPVIRTSRGAMLNLAQISRMDFAPLLLLSDRNVVTTVLGRRNVWESPVAGIQLCLTPSGALHNHPNHPWVATWDTACLEPANMFVTRAKIKCTACQTVRDASAVTMASANNLISWMRGLARLRCLYFD